MAHGRNELLNQSKPLSQDDGGTSQTSVGRGVRSDTGVLDFAKKSLVLLRGTAAGRASALSLACAGTDTSGGKAVDPNEETKIKIGYFEWQDYAAQRCLAGNDDDDPEEEGDDGAANEDLPTRCVHCSFPRRLLLQPPVIMRSMPSQMRPSGPR